MRILPLLVLACLMVIAFSALAFLGSPTALAQETAKVPAVTYGPDIEFVPVNPRAGENHLTLKIPDELLKMLGGKTVEFKEELKVAFWYGGFATATIFILLAEVLLAVLYLMFHKAP